MGRRRENNELAVRMAMASVGGTLSFLSVPFLERALNQAEGPPKRSELTLCVIRQVAGRTRIGHGMTGTRILRPTTVEIQTDAKGHAGSYTNSAARAFFTKASAGAMGKYFAKEITEADKGKICKGGEEDADGRKGREEDVVEGATERARRDTELDEHEQRPLGIVDPIPCPLTYIIHSPFESFHRDIEQHLRVSALSLMHNFFF